MLKSTPVCVLYERKSLRLARSFHSFRIPLWQGLIINIMKSTGEVCSYQYLWKHQFLQLLMMNLHCAREQMQEGCNNADRLCCAKILLKEQNYVRKQLLH